MGSYMFTVPDIRDEDVVLTEDDARFVLNYFWPSKSEKIRSVGITLDIRRFSQTLLIAAIDASFSLGIIDSLKSFAFRDPYRVKISGIIKKLTIGLAKSWWRKIKTTRDLHTIEIYYVAREAIAYAQATELELLLEGIAMVNLKKSIFAYIRSDYRLNA